ncbi:hypothetical protein [Sulfurirhabdus autotrophica]|uniref:RsbT antagonist protein RsbS n=1 Tax=Sulfurirhabdus autotrophica TaxID=1706046 RepID=A0A4V6P3T6_9PROT|nr:hypothetical protein [Sulfurirhabdus autotrophica]TCV83279.1 rsbT antagonist protein RsbS [Sulfurirhabdus autotrophica]
MNQYGYHLTPIGGGDFLLEPMYGLDTSKADELIEGILLRLQASKSVRLYYDLGEITIIDPVYYTWLELLARACCTMNVRMVCIHMQPTAAFALSHFLQGDPAFETALDVDSRNSTVV